MNERNLQETYLKGLISHFVVYISLHMIEQIDSSAYVILSYLQKHEEEQVYRNNVSDRVILTEIKLSSILYNEIRNEFSERILYEKGRNTYFYTIRHYKSVRLCECL